MPKISNFDLITLYKEMKSIKNICDELNINYSNLIQGYASSDNEQKVVEKLKVECFKLFSYIKTLEDNNE